MIQLNWADVYYQTPTFDSEQMRLATLRIPLDEVIDFGAPIGLTPLRDLLLPVVTYSPEFPLASTQLAMLVFAATRRPYALNSYFPLTQRLDRDEQRSFYRLAGEITRQPTFQVSLVHWIMLDEAGVLRADHNWRGADRKDARFKLVMDSTSESTAQLAFFVACHLAEVYFYRHDILERLMDTKIHIRLYASPEAFKQDGGAAGGNFSLEKGGIQLLLTRLFEGYNDKTPGVAPFLHEFGHLLDHFDAAERRLSGSRGTLPGMRPDEGPLYAPKARELFLKGKRLEAERYLRLHQYGYQAGLPLPIGHPYVFQNDTEFIAGYFEMFFRNPRYFAALNPDLFDSFVLVFGQDPRRVWKADFPFYIHQNQTYYRGDQRPPRHGLSL